MSNLRERHAKVLATIGPASRSPEMLEKLVEAGADAFRLNFSHGSHADHEPVVKTIRELEKKTGRTLTILQDLQGPKIRLGEMEKATVLETGQTFILDSEKVPGNSERCHLPHPEILDVLKPEDKVYINDGLVRLKVKESTGEKAVCEVTSGGKISSRKGVNLPGVDLPISSITPKDWKDLDFGLKMGVDWVAVSFVQKAEDIQEVKDKVGDRASVMAKIEMPNAVDRLSPIIAISDGVMIARGDLGVEMPLEEVPTIQKRIIRMCREAGKPVVVATQMLESMISNPSPTRAEVSDVANATFEGADALMLSAESAAGDYPVEAVSMMDSIIRRVERSSAWQPLIDARHPETIASIGDAITHAAFTTAQAIDARAIVTFTESGSTALRMSRQRPWSPILAVTPHRDTARRLMLAWGVHCVVGGRGMLSGDDVIKVSADAAKDVGLVETGENIVIVAGFPLGQVGSTNMIRVETVE